VEKFKVHDSFISEPYWTICLRMKADKEEVKEAVEPEEREENSQD
jgi:hypothetical protein